MGIFKKGMDWINQSDLEFDDDYVDEEEEDEVVVTKEPKKSKMKATPVKAVSNERPLPTNRDCAIAIFNPTTYQEATKIGIVLKNRKAAIVNVSDLPMEQSKRITDFLQGIVFAIDGNFHKIADKIVLYVPKNIDVDTTEATLNSDDE